MPSKRLYLGGLSEFVGKEEILKHLSNYGKLVEVKILSGYGFVQFDSEKDATDVLETFTGQPFLGSVITIEYAHPMRKDIQTEGGNSSGPPPQTQLGHASFRGQLRYTVVVANIPHGICWQDLKDFARSAGGNIAFCDIDRNRHGRGFLYYASRTHADRAVKLLDRKVLGGNVVEVFEQGTSYRPENRYRSRSRSPRRYCFAPDQTAPDSSHFSATSSSAFRDYRPEVTRDRRWRPNDSCGYKHPVHAMQGLKHLNANDLQSDEHTELRDPRKRPSIGSASTDYQYDQHMQNRFERERGSRRSYM